MLCLLLRKSDKLHIPDGLIDPKMSAGMAGAAAVALALCLSRVKQAVTALKQVKALAVSAGSAAQGAKRVLTSDGMRHLKKMGMAASLIFMVQMFDFPVINGTTGHLLGGVFAAVVLGPFAGALVMAAVLIVQAVFFADGGLLALGLNIINISLIPSIACYYIYYWMKKAGPEWFAAAAAAWISVVAAFLAYAAETGFSKEMLDVHMIVGIAEALATVVLVKMFRSATKEEINQ